jgi:hypothetical protein
MHTVCIFTSMALRRCAWCEKTLGIAPGPAESETHGICDACEARLAAESALAHALVGLRAITDEMERARAGIWPPGRGPKGGLSHE